MSKRPPRLAAGDRFIDLLSAAARRPSRNCLLRQRQSYASKRNVRCASSSPSSNDKGDAKTSPNKPTPIPPKPPGLRVPLHVLLDRNPTQRSAISQIPIPRGVRGEKFTPSPLTRPIGMPFPPERGQNCPKEQRSWNVRNADFQSYERAIERRNVMLRTFFRPTYQEWKRLDYWRGKSFVASERLFRRDRALWFPNMWGPTLRKGTSWGDGAGAGRDIVDVLRGKVSVVALCMGRWADAQVATFLDDKANPELKALLEASGGLAQRVDVSIQNDLVKWLLATKVFKRRLRRNLPPEQWEKYFFVWLARDVRRGLPEEVRDAMGLLNSQVGYVYLLDPDCRIRWAASGDAWEGEVGWLNDGIKKLVEEARLGPKVAPAYSGSLAPRAKGNGPTNDLVRGDLLRQVEEALARKS